MTQPDEDYRVKNAREGKAFYIQGKTVEQMREEQTERDRENLRVNMEVNNDRITAVGHAVDSAGINYAMAADALELMSMACGGELVASDDYRLSNTMQLLSFGMRRLAETDGEELSQFGMKLERSLRDSFEFIPADKEGNAA